MAKLHNHHRNFDEGLVDNIPAERIEQPDNRFNCLSSIDAASEGSMQFSAVLTMGWSAIASSSQPVPCRDSYSRSNHDPNTSKQQC